ncbi:hypothetical protein COL922a_010053 [Colletotrichum nupharicola]|nr:hypothetical protein COL922a_010053 [Colletotrichum nupharicola]
MKWCTGRNRLRVRKLGVDIVQLYRKWSPKNHAGNAIHGYHAPEASSLDLQIFLSCLDFRLISVSSPRCHSDEMPDIGARIMGRGAHSVLADEKQCLKRRNPALTENINKTRQGSIVMDLGVPDTIPIELVNFCRADRKGHIDKEAVNRVDRVGTPCLINNIQRLVERLWR